MAACEVPTSGDMKERTPSASRTTPTYPTRHHSSALLNPQLAVIGSSPHMDIHLMAAMQRPWNARTSSPDATALKKEGESTVRPLLNGFTRVPSDGLTSGSIPHRGMDCDATLPRPQRSAQTPNVAHKENVNQQPSKSDRSNAEEASNLNFFHFSLPFSSSFPHSSHMLVIMAHLFLYISCQLQGKCGNQAEYRHETLKCRCDARLTEGCKPSH